MNTHFDTLIIGGGLAGLVAANRLARDGLRAGLLEKSAVLGGRARTTNDDGHRMNLGPHALYRAGALAKALATFGLDVPSHRVAPTGYFLDGDERHTAVTGFTSLLTTGALTLAGKVELARFMARMKSFDPAALAETSADQFIAESFADDSGRRVASALARLVTYADDPKHLSAGALLEQLVSGTFAGVDYVDGGWATIVERLAESARAAGAELSTQVAVTAVRREGARIYVDAGDTTYTADAAILALAPDACRRLLGPSALDALTAHERPVRAASLDVALSRLPNPRAIFALGLDEPTYFSVHSAWASVAPPGAATIHAAAYLGPDDTRTPAATRAMLERVMDRMQPGWREVVVNQRFLPNLIVTPDLPSAARGGLAGRPRIDAAAIEGVYVAGDWVGPHGMLADAAAASGLDAAERVARAAERVAA